MLSKLKRVFSRKRKSVNNQIVDSVNNNQFFIKHVSNEEKEKHYQHLERKFMK